MQRNSRTAKLCDFIFEDQAISSGDRLVFKDEVTIRHHRGTCDTRETIKAKAVNCICYLVFTSQLQTPADDKVKGGCLSLLKRTVILCGRPSCKRFTYNGKVRKKRLGVLATKVIAECYHDGRNEYLDVACLCA